jgi:phosphohistidine swiveling domain-containing protein
MISRQKVNWRVYERDHIYPQNISAYSDLMNLRPSVKHRYLANHFEVISFIDDYFWWARDVNLLEKTARRWFNSWLTQNQARKEIINLYYRSHQQIKIELPLLKEIVLNKTTNKQLYDVYASAKGIFLNSIIFSEYATDLFDDFFDKVLVEKVKGLSGEKISESDLGQLIKPAQVSANLLYKKALLKFSFKLQVNLKELDNLRQIYSWIAMSWDGSHRLTLNQVKKDLTDLKKSTISARRLEFNRISNFSKEIKFRRYEIIKKYRLPQARLDIYFYLLDTFTMFHDWRKETQMKCNQVILPVLKEIARRFDLKYLDILFYQGQEIKEVCYFGRKVAKSSIIKRHLGATFVIKNGRIQKYYGQEAKAVLKRLVLDAVKAKAVSQVKGLAASHGKITGRACVVKSAKEALKILKPGDILITSMTTIDYIPVIKKAGAIITDDGGITCHAAIVSREFNKPCVVGTKIATQIFKTRDFVEVDANKGVIKLIK